MKYCPDCGTPHECAAEHAGDENKTRIRIAEIERDRDIRLAELASNAARAETEAAVDIAEAESAIEQAGAEGVAEGMETVLDEITGGGEAGEPVVVNVEAEAEPEPEPEETPPPPETGHQPAPGSKGRGGWWSNYALP